MPRPILPSDKARRESSVLRRRSRYWRLCAVACFLLPVSAQDELSWEVRAYIHPVIGDWSECSSSCTRTRVVMCATRKGRLVPNDLCGAEMPLAEQTCTDGACAPPPTGGAVQSDRGAVGSVSLRKQLPAKNTTEKGFSDHTGLRGHSEPLDTPEIKATKPIRGVARGSRGEGGEGDTDNRIGTEEVSHAEKRIRVPTEGGKGDVVAREAPRSPRKRTDGITMARPDAQVVGRENKLGGTQGSEGLESGAQERNEDVGGAQDGSAVGEGAVAEELGEQDEDPKTPSTSEGSSHLKQQQQLTAVK
ncbi:unnamed protein product, partial [Discosporangium mesarthrocarpum]